MKRTEFRAAMIESLMLFHPDLTKTKATEMTKEFIDWFGMSTNNTGFTKGGVRYVARRILEKEGLSVERVEFEMDEDILNKYSDSIKYAEELNERVQRAIEERKAKEEALEPSEDKK